MTPASAPSDQAPPAAASTLTAAVLDAARGAGLDAVGICGAGTFDDTRAILEERKAAGLHGGMSFTYGDPARSTDPSRALPGARSLVVAARTYRRTDVPPPPAAEGPHGRVARYSWRDHYEPLRAALDAVAGVLRAAGHDAAVLVDDNALVDRAAAHRAGLGWFGKNANLLLPGKGSWFVLGSVVTTAALDATVTDGPTPDGCGACTRCLPACPTGAIVAPGVIDANRCLAWLLEAKGTFPVEHRMALGDRIYGCDECQEVCPPNRTADRHHPPAEPDPVEDEAWVPLLRLLERSDDEILAAHGRWYIPRRQARYVRRNALVVLGNAGDPADEATVATVRRYLVDDDPLLRAHAVWAAARLGRHDVLADVAATEQDPDVLAELAAAPSVVPVAAAAVVRR